MTVTERVRELGLLRAAGATRRQVGRFVLAPGDRPRRSPARSSALVVGRRPRRAHGRLRPDDRLDPVRAGRHSRSRRRSSAIAIGLVRHAGGLARARPPGRARSRRSRRSRRGSTRRAAQRARLRWLVAVFVAVGVAGLLVWPRDAGLARPRPSRRPSTRSCSSSSLPRRSCSAPLARLAGLPFARLFRLEERLARAALARDRSRTALTVGALTVGLAMIVAIGGVAGQARAAAARLARRGDPGRRDRHLDPPDRSRRRGTRSTSSAAVDGVAPGEPDRDLRGRQRRRPDRRRGRRRHGPRSPTAGCGSSPATGDGAWPRSTRGGATVAAAGARRRGWASASAASSRSRRGRRRPLDLRVVGDRRADAAGSRRRVDARRLERRDDALGVAGADVFAVRYAAGSRGRRAAGARARPRAASPSSRIRSTGSRAPSTPRSGASSALFDALGDHRRDRRGPRDRQHPDDERPRAGPRDRRAARGRDDDPPGAADRSSSRPASSGSAGAVLGILTGHRRRAP